jgi:phage tail sheath gpL-like
LISIAITASQTTASIATALAAAINLDSACWVTAEYADNDVTLEAKFMGVLGNEIPVVVGYNFEEVPPINITVTRMSGGAGTPDLNNVISNLGENPYDYIATPFTDSASLQALDQAVAERWHAMAAFNIQSVVYGVVSGTYDAISAKGKSLNSEFITLVGVDGQPQTSWIWAASLVAAVSDPLTNDPAAPITTLELLGLKAPRKCWNWKLRNELLFSGISTFTSDKAGNVYVDKLITTYQYDAQGYPDASYLSIHVPELMRNIRRIQAAALASSFRGYKLTDYPEQHAGGQKIISTDGIKAFLVALYGRSLMDERAWCTDANHYAESLLVERDPENRQRINYHDEPVMIGQLEIIAGHSELQHG